MIEPTWMDHALIAVFGGIGLYAAFVGQRKMKEMTPDSKTKISIYWSNGIGLWLAGIATCVVWAISGRSLASVGLTLEHESFAMGLLITAAFLIWSACETWREIGTEARRGRLLARWQRDVTFIPATPREVRHFAFLGLAAGVNEEIIFRGFLISYLSAFTGVSAGGLAAAVAVPALAFAALHWYQGWSAVLKIIALAGAFGAIFVVTGSILIPIILHTAVDLLGGWIACRLARDDAGHQAVTMVSHDSETRRP